MEQELERLEGTVEDIIYLNEDNGYTVFEVSGGGVVTVVCGVVGELHAGESVVCRGRYENHATYGRQFHAQECETDMPKDLEAVYAFLASRSLPYIGARTADKIIDKFGAAALEVIANDPAQLTLIPGISADKADRIQQEFKRMFGMRELIAYLAQFEISPRRAMEVFRTFGPGAMQAIQQNPYLLCGEPLQLDFRHADSIAQYYQMAGDCAQRLEAALLRTLRHNAGNGHTCLPRSYQFDPVKDIQVLCPTKLGPTGTQALNAELQAMLNPPRKGKPELQSAARVFRVGDKVMQVRNNYEITWQRIGGEQGVGAYNGDIGIVESIDVRSRSMVVRMDDRRLVYPAENLNELEIAYAITVHKSQGSEFPAVILPAAQVPPRLCYRNLFYTGVTRGRKLCIVVGRRDVVNRMMSNIRQNLRYSGLAALLAEALPPEQENL